MGPTALKSKPTVHDKALNNMYKSQQLDRSTSKASYAASDITRHDNGPRSPVSPLDSNGETWKYPHSAQAHQNRLGALYEVPLVEVPQKLVFSRPMSYYDGLQPSPEPTSKDIFSDLPPAPPRSRLSRPFDQPQPVPSERQTTASGKPSPTFLTVPMQANMTRADSFLHRQPQQASSQTSQTKRKPVPAPLTIPPPSHQTRRQHEPSSRQENQHPAQSSGNHQGRQAQRVIHKGWNPLAEPPRQQRTAPAPQKEHRRDHRGGDDVEKQAGPTRAIKRPKYRYPNDGGRKCIFFLVIVFILGVVLIAVVATKATKS